MPRSTPSWWNDNGRKARLLTPLSWFYQLGRCAHNAFTKPQQCTIPVFCIGNAVAGGAGKTPVAIALASWLQQQGIAVHIVSRGYGGSSSGPLRVDPAMHSFHDVGDEPLLLARHVPVWVSRDRPAGVEAAASAGATLALLDDGLQNPHLIKDTRLLVIDGGFGIGNGRLLPAGPLRQPFADAADAADAVVIIGEDHHQLASHIPADTPVFHATLVPDSKGAATLKSQRVIAFAAIGRPQKFFDTLNDLGAELVAQHRFADHVPLSDDELSQLKAQAKESDAVLVTTEKDRVKLTDAQASGIIAVPVTLQFANDDALHSWLRERLAHMRVSR